MILPDRSPFEILGVSETATPDEVRRAYRRQARRYHPDLNPGDARAQEAFLAVQEAYRRLDPADPDAGYDAERVAAEMQRAAAEAERRRARPATAGRSWQQVRVPLHQPRAAFYADLLRTRRGTGGLAAGAAAACAFAVGLGLAGAPVAAASAVGAVLGAVVAALILRTAEVEPWAVETHWRGLRDRRWEVTVGWEEICEVHEGEQALDLALTPSAAARLRAAVPETAFARPGVYRLPLAAGSRLAAIVQAQLSEREEPA